jgi:hypothetical protein
MKSVAERAALYKLQTAAMGEEDIKAVQSKCYVAYMERAGLYKTTPDRLVSSLVTLDWWQKHCQD